MALEGFAELVAAVNKEVGEIATTGAALDAANTAALEAQAAVSSAREANDAEESQAVTALEALVARCEAEIEAIKR